MTTQSNRIRRNYRLPILWTACFIATQSSAWADADDLHIENTAKLNYSVAGQYFSALSNRTTVASGGDSRLARSYRGASPASGNPQFVHTAAVLTRSANSSDPERIVAALVRDHLAARYPTNTVMLTADKSQQVFDAAGDPLLASGSRILYRIVISATGSGTANATVMTDPVPAKTTYVADSLKLNGNRLTDAPDSDGGQILAGTPDRVQVMVGDVAATTGPKIVEFEVRVD
jgi:uncharacterized repeat protein (TIGR01451 family)